MLGDETGDADAVTLAGGEQVTGEAGIEPVQGDKNCDAVMEPKSGDAIHKADMPVQMGVLWHRKRGRLKTGATSKYDSTGVWVNEASAYITLDAFTSPFNLRIAGGLVVLFIAACIVLVLAVAGVLATLTPTARVVVQVTDGNTLPYSSNALNCSCSGGEARLASYGKGGRISAATGVALSATAAPAAQLLASNTQSVEFTQRPVVLASVAANRLWLDDDDRLGLSGGDRPGCEDGYQFGSGGGNELGRGCRFRIGSDSAHRFVCGG